MLRDRIATLLAVAVVSLLVIAPRAHAQTEPCPGPSESRADGELGPNSTSMPYEIDLLPCQTVVVQLTGTASSHPSGNANMQLVIRNGNGESLATTNFLCGNACSTSVPLPGSVPGYPLPGTRGPGGLAKDVIVKVGLFNWFGTPPARYQLLIRKEPRTGYNTAGNAFANAPLVNLPATQLGSIHPSDPGQYVKVRLNPNQGFYVSGHVRGHQSSGAYYEINVYNAAQQEVKKIHAGTAYGGPHLYTSGTPFIHTGAQSADFYVRIWCRFWPVYDFSLNIVSYTLTTEVTEVGFRSDHPVSRWPNRQRIDDPDGTTPTWVKGRGGDQKMEYPAAYTMGAKPTLFTVISINPALPLNTTASVRVKKDGTVLGARNGLTFAGATGRVDALPLDVDLESSPGVKASDYQLDWEWSLDGGTNWTSIGQSGEHRIYWTYATPFEFPFTNMKREASSLFRPTYTLALEKATEAANGSGDPLAIKSQINLKLKQELKYDPERAIGRHPLQVYSGNTGQCDDVAHLMRGLLRSIGLSAETFYLWGGGPGPSGQETYWYAFGDRLASFRVQRPDEDGVGVNPHFTFHAVTGDSTTGLLYDPSYGLQQEGPLVGLDETLDAPGGTFISDPAQVRQVWSIVPSLTEITPGLASCPHSRRAGPFAGFVDQNIPDTMVAGQTYAVSLTFRNTGDDPWLTDQGFSLAASDPKVGAVWGGPSTALPTQVMPDDEVMFTVMLTAPTATGSYPLSFRIQQTGTAFGGVSTPVSVNVQ